MGFLRDCLNSIFRSEYPKSKYEVIIIDGGSKDGTQELCTEFPSITFITEKVHGLAFARNLGAKLAKGSIIVYTDDDCIVDKTWLKNLIAVFNNYKLIIGVGGPVYPLHPQSIPQKILVKAALGLMDEGKIDKPIDCIITSNAAFKREAFKIARFDETLGTTRKGKLILSGEDIDFCRTLVDSGYRLRYTPDARVYHQIPKKRISVSYIVKHALHSGLSRSAYYFKKKKSRIWSIRYAIGDLGHHILQLPFDTSFTSCYNIIISLSTLIVCSTGLDEVFLSIRTNPDSNSSQHYK